MDENMGAESDYIFAAEALPADMYDVPDPPSWQATAAATSLNFTHRPIFANLQMTPKAPQPTAPPPQPERAPTIRRPFYGDVAAYRAVAAATTRELQDILPALRDPNTSAAATAELLFDRLEKAVKTAIPKRRAGGIVNRPPDLHLKRAALPPPVVKAIQTARAARRRATSGEPDEIAAAQQASRHAQHLLRKHHGRGRAKVLADLRLLRVRCGHRFFKYINGFAPDDPAFFVSEGNNIPSEPGGKPAAERFPEYYKSKFASRPPPPATAAEGWLRHVREQPAPVAAAMGRPFTAREILPLLFPPDKGHLTSHQCNATGVHEPHVCPLCNHMTTLAGLYEGEGDPANAAPRHYARGHAQSATNFTDTELRFFHIAWARPEGVESYRAHRLRVAEACCTYLNKILVEGTMPTELAVNITLPIPKGSASGIQEEPWSPDNHRFIVLSSIAAKILALAIDARLKHWAARDTAIVSTASQGAFIPLLSTEWHALALTEAIKGQWRARKAAYVAFVDFDSAYPSVHPAALAAVLRRQGLPGNLTGVIESWLLNRTASVQVNGATTDPVPTAMGLGQGDAHAPILYTIFINSLANFLRANGHDLGINNNGTLVVHLAFADDVAAPEPDPEKVQRHLRLIEEWATAWGHTVKVGEKKTAAMYFPVPGAKPLPNPTPVITLASGMVVPWVQTYKYLGCALTPKLDLSSALDLIINRVKLTATRLFGFNSITSRLDNASKAQLLKCAFSPYLLALVPPTKANIDKLQKELRKLARVVTILPAAFADDGTVDLEGGIPTALYSIIRSRLTTLLALRLTPHQDAPAAAIIRSHVGRHGRTNVSSWVATTTELLQHYSNIGAGPFDDIRTILSLNREPHLGDVTRAAQVFARRACTASLRASFLAENGGGAHVTGLSQRPPAGEGPTQQCHALALSYQHYSNDLLGNLPFTPMSCRVALGGGSPLPLTTALLSEAQRGALAFIRLGAVALSAAPLGVPSWRVTSTGKGARKDCSDPETWRVAKRGRPCPLCEGATADPFHVIHECQHSDVVAARATARAKAIRYIPILLAKVEKAAEGAGRFSQPPPAGGWRVSRNLLESHSWETTTSGNLLLRLLAAAPWPAAAVDADDAPLARHLGRCFDAARLSNTSLHPVYNSWCGFGSRATLALFAAYASAVTAAQQ
jgi:hypothetical protein